MTSRLACLCILVSSIVPGLSHAISVAMSLPDAVTRSDVIVIATLGRTTSETRGAYVWEAGRLVVDRVLCGSAAPGDTLLLQWSNLVNVACGRTEHAAKAGRRMIWFLERDGSGGYRADHSGLAMDIDALESVLDTMRTYPYQIGRVVTDPGDAVVVRIVFRNSTESPLQVPDIRAVHDRVTFGPGFVVRWERMLNGAQDLSAWERARFAYDASLLPRTLAPGAAYDVDIPASDIFGEFPPGTHRFTVTVNGRRTHHAITVRTAWMARLEQVRGTPAEMEFYVQTIRSGDASTMTSAITMISSMRGQVAPVADDLMALCDSLDGWQRGFLTQAVLTSNISIERRTKFALRNLHSEDPELRVEAIRGATTLLRTLPTAEQKADLLNRLAEFLDDSFPDVRSAAASALGAGGPAAEPYLPQLENCIRYDGESAVRAAAKGAVDTIQGRGNCCRCSKESL